MYDDIAYLIKEKTTGTDSDGNEIIKRTSRMVFCRVRSVSRDEYYDAATDDLKPEIMITISHRIDYDSEKLVELNGEYYDVIRTYWREDEVELTLQKSIGIRKEEEESS